MSRLYMIRLENGNSVILQAETEDEAIKKAGLTVNPVQFAAEFGHEDVADTHFQMVNMGIGPQNFTIRELHDFMCVAVLKEDGNFDFRLDGDAGIDEFYLDYPYIDVAAEENAKMSPADVSIESPVVQDLFFDAVNRERARMLVTPQ